MEEKATTEADDKRRGKDELPEEPLDKPKYKAGENMHIVISEVLHPLPCPPPHPSLPKQILTHENWREVLWTLFCVNKPIICLRILFR